MERLEAAIKKVREAKPDTPNTSHADATGRHAPGGVGRNEPSVPGSVQEAWEALPKTNLNREVLKQNRIIAQLASGEATAFDVLRTRTLRHMQEHGWRRLAITSPTPGGGKTTLALNMALSLSRQKKLRTIEMEMDMRRPNQWQLLGLPQSAKHMSQPAVAQIISGQSDFSELAKRVDHNLAIVANERPAPNASDLLLDSQIGDVLDDIEARYKPDVFLFDMPPVLQIDDTLAFMQHVDGVLIVAAAESNTIAEIDLCERELAAQTNVMGVVLNKCRISGAGTQSYDYTY